jgi:hypothetical protein
MPRMANKRRATRNLPVMVLVNPTEKQQLELLKEELGMSISDITRLLWRKAVRNCKRSNRAKAA